MLWQICSQVSGQLLVGVPNFRLLPWFIVWGRFNVPTLQTAQPWARNQLNIKCKTGKDALPTPSTPSHPCLNTPPPLGRLISGTKSKKGRGGGGKGKGTHSCAASHPFHGSSLTLDGLYSQAQVHHHCHHCIIMVLPLMMMKCATDTVKGGQNSPTWWHFVRCQFSGGRHLPGGAAADLLLTPS